MHYSQINLRNVAVLRAYTEDMYKITCLASCRQAGIEFDENHKFTDKGDGGNDGKLANNLSRTKSRIFELSYCNPWELFVTLTLDPKKYDRKDLPKFIKDLSQMVRDYRKKTGNELKYLLIPERHQDGSWHMHGFFMGLPLDALHAFDRSEHLPYRILQRLDEGIAVYTWEAYAKRFGYAVMEGIQNHEAASRYITKYVTKEALHTITELNAHAFYASKGLNESQVVARDLFNREISNPDYKNDYVACKWFSDAESAKACFKEVTQ